MIQNSDTMWCVSSGYSYTPNIFQKYFLLEIFLTRNFFYNFFFIFKIFLDRWLWLLSSRLSLDKWEDNSPSRLGLLSFRLSSNKWEDNSPNHLRKNIFEGEKIFFGRKIFFGKNILKIFYNTETIIEGKQVISP